LRCDRFSGVSVGVLDFDSAIFSSTSSSIFCVQAVGGALFEPKFPSTKDGRGITSRLTPGSVADDSDLELGRETALGFVISLPLSEADAGAASLLLALETRLTRRSSCPVSADNCLRCARIRSMLLDVIGTGDLSSDCFGNGRPAMTMCRLPIAHEVCATCATAKCMALGVGASVLLEGAEGTVAPVESALVCGSA
jgi:hypothetical protein